MRKLSVSILWLALGPLVTTAFAQEFSADMVTLQAEGGSHAGKIYVGKDKLRFEPVGQGPMGNTVTIADLARQIHYTLIPQRHVYVESQSHGLLPYWRPSDVNNACPEWERLASQLNAQSKPSSCRRVGNELLQGRSTVKYASKSADGSTDYAWLDSRLHYLVKLQGRESGMELRNIREGPQPASLFQIPAGYQKMEPHAARKPGQPPAHP